MLTASNAKAYAVLSILFDLYGDKSSNLRISPSINGREDGFHVYNINSPKHVTFAQMRGTDAIVVYYGDICDFNLQGLGPTDKTYREQHITFHYSDYLAAATWIESYFKRNPNNG